MAMEIRSEGSQQLRGEFERTGMVNKERFLTARWNNILSLALGFVPLVYVVVVLSTSILSPNAGFIGLVIIGVVY